MLLPSSLGRAAVGIAVPSGEDVVVPKVWGVAGKIIAGKRVSGEITAIRSSLRVVAELLCRLGMILLRLTEVILLLLGKRGAIPARGLIDLIANPIGLHRMVLLVVLLGTIHVACRLRMILVEVLAALLKLLAVHIG